MNDCLQSIFLPCLTRRKPWHTTTDLEKPPSGSDHDGSDPAARITRDEAAERIVTLLFGAEKKGAAPTTLASQIHGVAHAAGGWSEWLADRVRQGIERALTAGRAMSSALAAAYAKACDAAVVFEGFVKEHPLASAVFVTVIAIGVLVILAPYVVELLGFGELGPVEGTWAAAWQSTYRGFVPKGSLFSYLQRLGMTWK